MISYLDIVDKTSKQFSVIKVQKINKTGFTSWPIGITVNDKQFI